MITLKLIEKLANVHYSLIHLINEFKKKQTLRSKLRIFASIQKLIY